MPRLSLGSISKIFSAILIVAFGTSACQPKPNSDDQTQSEIGAANLNLQQMDIIESKLRDAGILIHGSQFSTFQVFDATEAELIDAKLKLEEYVAFGRSTLRVADRPDVAYAERERLEERVNTAQKLLEKVRSRLSTTLN